MRRDLEQQVVVITGASGGIAKATALAFARAGAHVVLGARSAVALESVAAECRRLGVQALAVPTDVGDPAAVAELAAAAVDRHGRIDTWVNAAGVLLAGTLGDEPVDEVQRLIQTNVAGPAFGAREALLQFRRQGDGVLIDVSSVLGVIANPFVPTYVMSKFAVRGLSLSLHHLAAAWPGVRVCVVLPGPVDTQLFQHAANHSGRSLRAIAPAMSPERVAAAILSCAERPRRQVVVGATGKAVMVAHRVSPRLVEWVAARAVGALLQRRPAPGEQPDHGYAAGADGAIGGGWRQSRARRVLGDVVGRRRSGRGPLRGASGARAGGRRRLEPR